MTSADNVLVLCPVHGHSTIRSAADGSFCCSSCSLEPIITDISLEDWNEYVHADKDADEYGYDALIEKSFATDTESMLSNLRSGNSRKTESALSLLMWRTEREQYIPEIVPLLKNHRLKKAAERYLIRCPDFSLDPYLSFFNYDPSDRFSVRLYTPVFLEHMARHRKIACEKCGVETSNLVLKIRSLEKVAASEKSGIFVRQTIQFKGEAVPHILCDSCALKAASKFRKLKDKSNQEKIQSYLSYGLDVNLKTVHSGPDIGGVIPDLFHQGLNYEYLISGKAAYELKHTAAEKERLVLKALIDCAMECKNTIQKILRGK